MQKETLFKIKVQKRLKEEFGPNAWVVKVQQLALLGVPDLLGCVNGHFFAFELKKDAKEKPSRLQAWCLQAIDRAGGLARVVCPENFERCLKELVVYGRLN